MLVLRTELKGLGFAMLSSILFMLLHMSNPEVLNLSGLDLAAGAGNYFVTGLFLYMTNLLIGGMEAGLIFHYLNNFFCFVLVSEKVTAVPTPSIFIDYGESTGVGSLISVLISCALPTFYLTRCYHRKNKYS